ncbi:hypothetical protein ATANTOWER_020858 [Ataeniobius toweri]|uniref:Uncharacterized protein n=1 Tax=Ataeniobius toweri TaxID=208326 RepID=A0ABU7AGR8_9TELE|nr:hypothetical protein [Ataeniobius toweri]
MVWGGISLEGRMALHVLTRGSLTAIRIAYCLPPSPTSQWSVNYASYLSLDVASKRHEELHEEKRRKERQWEDAHASLAAPPGRAQGIPRPAERHSPSSVSWAVPWASSRWDVPGGIRYRCPSHLNWLLSMWRSSGSTPSPYF